MNKKKIQQKQKSSNNVLKLDDYDEDKEIEFELRFLKSLTTKQRFQMMFQKTREILNLLEKSGNRKPSQIIKRT